jgi:hypothetical protein
VIGVGVRPRRDGLDREATKDEQIVHVKEQLRLLLAHARRSKNDKLAIDCLRINRELIDSIGGKRELARAEERHQRREVDVTPIDDASQERAARLLLESRGYTVKEPSASQVPDPPGVPDRGP